MDLKKIEKKRVKIDKVENYYNFFVSMLNAEDKKLQKNEHLWVLGTDKIGHTVCGYIASIGYKNFSTAKATKIFGTALQTKAVKIIICQNKYNKKELELSEDDLEITGLIYYKSQILGIELIDHVIISNLSINSPTPLYYSHLEHGLMDFISQDVLYKTPHDIRTELAKYEKDHSYDLLKVRKEQIVTRLFDIGISAKNIAETTHISESEVNEIIKCIEESDDNIYI